MRVVYLLQKNHRSQKVVTSSSSGNGAALGVHALDHVYQVDVRVLLAGHAIAKCAFNDIFVLKRYRGTTLRFSLDLKANTAKSNYLIVANMNRWMKVIAHLSQRVIPILFSFIQLAVCFRDGAVH